VQSGNVGVGLVAVSSLKAAYSNTQDQKYLDYTVLPTNQYPDIIQQGVIISSTKKHASAKQLMQFLMTEATQQQLIELGYRIKDNNASK